jgi:hypothetical protein
MDVFFFGDTSTTDLSQGNLVIVENAVNKCAY